MKQSLISFWKENKIITSKKLLEAFEKVPREDFILKEYKKEAYDDRPLPILERQTISQPTTVMMMLQALELKKTDKVLEVGSGSGYNASILSKLVKKVYTTEIIPELVEFAKKNLKNIKNVMVIHCDGSKGLEKYAPFDKIIITAASEKVPDVLFKQLKDNGILIAPVGPPYLQNLMKYKKKKGKIESINLGNFMFVPLKET